MTGASLLVGIVAGALGVGYFMYGKRQARYAPLISGMLLCIYPYFMSSVPWMLAVGALLAAAPFFIDF